MDKTSAIGKYETSPRSYARCRCVFRNSRSGFTLIELLVVLAIVVLLIASMPFAMKRMLPGYRFRAVTEQLIETLRDARSRSMAHGTTIEIACGNSQLPIESNRDAVRTIVVPANITWQCFATPDGRRVKQLTFYPDGSSTGGVLTLNDGKRDARIELSSLTGRVRAIG